MFVSRTLSFARLLLCCAVVVMLMSPAVLAGGKLDLNTATVEQLVELPGIGEKTAQAIVKFREKHGGFDSVEQLLEVKGIGPRKLEKLKEYVTVHSKGD